MAITPVQRVAVLGESVEVNAEIVLFSLLVDKIQRVNVLVSGCPSPRPSREREGSESPSVVKGAGEASGLDPHTHAVSVGRYCRVKGPSPRRFAPVGRTNPLTRHPHSR